LAAVSVDADVGGDVVAATTVLPATTAAAAAAALTFVNSNGGTAVAPLLSGRAVYGRALHFRGALSQVNTALANLWYRGDNDFHGNDTLSVHVYDEAPILTTTSTTSTTTTTATVAAAAVAASVPLIHFADATVLSAHMNTSAAIAATATSAYEFQSALIVVNNVNDALVVTAPVGLSVFEDGVTTLAGVTAGKFRY
jgi:hypothetical protein